MVEGEELETIARRDIDSNQFMTIGTADEEGVPWSRRSGTPRRSKGSSSGCPIRRRGTRATSPPGRRSRS